jgi:hypothetical protein
MSGYPEYLVRVYRVLCTASKSLLLFHDHRREDSTARLTRKREFWTWSIRSYVCGSVGHNWIAGVERLARRQLNHADQHPMTRTAGDRGGDICYLSQEQASP